MLGMRLCQVHILDAPKYSVKGSIQIPRQSASFLWGTLYLRHDDSSPSKGHNTLVLRVSKTVALPLQRNQNLTGSQQKTNSPRSLGVVMVLGESHVRSADVLRERKFSYGDTIACRIHVEHPNCTLYPAIVGVHHGMMAQCLK